jgi:creatinine amidohydrolase
LYHTAPGILLEDLTWQQAERVLTPDAVVVIPLGAAAKEHGPHLRLKNDFALAEPAREQLASDGIVMHFTDILTIGAEAEKAVRQQEGGTHADEIETPMMLYMDPSLVDMSKAAKDYRAQGAGGLTRDPNGKGTYSPTGIWGDATLATREKGRRVVEAMVEGMLNEIAALRAAAPPAGR